MKRSLFILVVALTLALGSLAASAQTIGFSISTLDNPFFVALKDGAEARAGELDVSIRVVDAQDDPARQLSGMEDLIARGVDIILVNPADSAAIIPAILAANAAGIPVVSVDRDADGGEVVAHIASDNVLGGNMAGQLVADLLGGEGKVVELEGIPGTNAAHERSAGFNEVIGEYAGIEVVARQEAAFDRARGLTVMENILQAQSEIDAVFAHNDEMAMGALIAIEAAGRIAEMQVVGFDATDDAVAAVQDGRLLATVAQQPKLIGALGVETALHVLAGDDVEDFIPVPLELVTAD